MHFGMIHACEIRHHGCGVAKATRIEDVNRSTAYLKKFAAALWIDTTAIHARVCLYHSLAQNLERRELVF